MDTILQDSFPLQIDGERIPSVIPPIDTNPKRRAPWRRLYHDVRTHGELDAKQCRSCNQVKPASAFRPDPKSRDGLFFRCRDCATANNKRRHSETTPEQRRQYHEKHLKRAYGITLKERDAMFDAQGGRCAICGATEHGGRNWHVDHDHETGVVRGILCHGCNHALGGAHDNPDTLIAAAGYLRRNGK